MKSLHLSKHKVGGIQLAHLLNGTLLARRNSPPLTLTQQNANYRYFRTMQEDCASLA